MIKIAIALLLTNPFILSFNYRESSPSSLFPYFQATGESCVLGHFSNPAYLPLQRRNYINADYGKPYSMSVIDAANLRAGYGFNDFGLQLGWSRFGIDEYREDVVDGNLGYRPFRFFSCGFGISYYHLDINTVDLSYNRGLTDFRLSVLLLPFEWLNISYQQENIYSIIQQRREDMLDPYWSFGISLMPVRGVGFFWNINEMFYGYINSFSISTNLLPFLNLSFGYSREISSYSASISFLHRLLCFSYGLRHHPYLGMSHTIGFTIMSSALTLKQVNYNRRLKRRRSPGIMQKIDISRCTLDELGEIPVLSSEIAKRIINYRRMIGPVSEKVLFQIGLDAKEISELKDYIKCLTPELAGVGLIKQRKWKYKKGSRGGYSLKKRRILFQRLLEKGVSASTALRVARLALNRRKKELILDIKKFNDIQPEKRDAIIKICIDVL